MHYVYMVRCADGTLYTGYARDPEQRAKVHNAGRGAKYTAGRLPVRLVYREACESRSAALKREHAVKCLSRSEKEMFVTTQRATTSALSRARGSAAARR